MPPDQAGALSRLRINRPPDTPILDRVLSVGVEDRSLLVVLALAALLILACESLWDAVPAF